ncbi:MAG TPA: HD domain-containing protein [Opitutaceae bacterium]|nr:HD domain-containing protein [Opitutaceae bacterium]
MNPDHLAGVLQFLREAERLKQTWRSGRTSGGHPESTAAHTWRLCLMALVLERDLPGVDFSRLVKICLVHDLGEALGGDIPAIHQRPGESKAAQERRDLEALAAPLPPGRRAEILALWDEYEAAATAEARIAKALDKLETILQHNQGANPPEFDYAFNLPYGKKLTDAVPLAAQIRAILDEETRRRAGGG